MASQKSFWAMGLVIAALGPCLGCGASNLAVVQGNVTFDGQLVEQGSITFEPADGVGPVTGGTIQNGKYRLGDEGGMVPGQKVVRIRAVRSTGRRIEAGPPLPPGTMVDEISPFIPAVYNEKSTLNVQVAAGEVTHHFELLSKPSPR
jgi:hypothetical protein